MKDIIKYQTINVTKASGATEATYKDFKEQMDVKYEEVIGVAAFENEGSAENYKIGVSDNVDTYIDSTNKNFLLTTKDVSQREKFKPVSIPITDGRKLSVDLEITATTGADIDVDVVFMLRRRVTER